MKRIGTSTQKEFDFYDSIPFGKHKDEIIVDIMLSDFNYISWLNKNNIIELTERVIKTIENIEENGFFDRDKKYVIETLRREYS